MKAPIKMEMGGMSDNLGFRRILPFGKLGPDVAPIRAKMPAHEASETLALKLHAKVWAWHPASGEDLIEILFLDPASSGQRATFRNGDVHITQV